MTEPQQAFELKGSLFTLIVIKLFTIDTVKIIDQAKIMVKKTPNLFRQTPIVIDISKISDHLNHVDWPELHKQFAQLGMILVGILGDHPNADSITKRFNLALVTQSGQNSKTKSAPQTKTDISAERLVAEPIEPLIEPINVRTTCTTKTNKTSPDTLAGMEALKDEIHAQPQHTDAHSSLATSNTNLKMEKSKFITQHVRSGQQIYAKDCDLVVIGSVSHGAELLADGHIHVYGSMRGRALAGLSGNKEARIFCKKLDPELISIAGCYQTNEHIDPKKLTGAVQVYLQEDRLTIETLD